MKKIWKITLVIILGSCIGLGIEYYKENKTYRSIDDVLSYLKINPDTIINKYDYEDSTDYVSINDEEGKIKISSVNKINSKGKKCFKPGVSWQVGLNTDKMGTTEDNVLFTYNFVKDLPDYLKNISKRTALIGSSQSEDIQKLKIDDEAPTDIFNYEFKGNNFYIWYYKNIDISDKNSTPKISF
ncbi:hypothetical protein [Floricoccus penangensis]|uniref:hypothetical protein n=1 Tax=Floricoccus penangensis TaxID=1859475 RepID=UPI00203CF00E|nr:hypothetical protein [Floricoccus penangensis]URZ88144.1 hypothetical protein KIW23_03675 [Floricoccus penangensis]